ncbi:MAG: hypothetical protein ABEL76_09250 [Bradymonadaceae bacterium]
MLDRPPVLVDTSRSWALLVAVLVLSTAPACAEPFQPPKPPRDSVHYPIGLKLHPNGEFLYVVNSNFNAKYRENIGGTVSVVDTETLELRPKSTPYIPSFGGAIALNADASRAYVAARANDSVVALDVAEAGEGSDQPAGRSLFCTDDEGERTSNPADCTIQRVPDRPSGTRLGSDPFGLSVTTLRRSPPGSDGEVPIDLVNVSYLADNRVSTLSLPRQQTTSASLQNGSLVAGGNDIARRPGTLNFYVAGRSSNDIAIYSPFVNLRDAGQFGRVEALVGKGSFSLNVSSRSVDARGLKFAPSGDRLFVTSRSPDALHVIDVLDDGHDHVGTVPVGNNPADVAYHRTADGRPLVYVPCLDGEAIYVVDPQSQTVVDVIELGSSPYSIAIESRPHHCDGPGTRCRAYVSMFDDKRNEASRCGPDARQCGSVAVVQLDPESARYHRVISKIR